MLREPVPYCKRLHTLSAQCNKCSSNPFINRLPRYYVTVYAAQCGVDIDIYYDIHVHICTNNL